MHFFDMVGPNFELEGLARHLGHNGLPGDLATTLSPTSRVNHQQPSACLSTSLGKALQRLGTLEGLWGHCVHKPGHRSTQTGHPRTDPNPDPNLRSGAFRLPAPKSGISRHHGLSSTPLHLVQDPKTVANAPRAQPLPIQNKHGRLNE